MPPASAEPASGETASRDDPGMNGITWYQAMLDWGHEGLQPVCADPISRCARGGPVGRLEATRGSNGSLVLAEPIAKGWLASIRDGRHQRDHAELG